MWFSLFILLLFVFCSMAFSLLSPFLAMIFLAGYFHVRVLQFAFPCLFVSSPTMFPV